MSDTQPVIIAADDAIARSDSAGGVETETQRDRLAELGSLAMQGYLYERPTSADDAERWLPAVRSPLAAQ